MADFETEIKTLKLAMSEITLKKGEQSHIDSVDNFESNRYIMREPIKVQMKPPELDGTNSWNNYLMRGRYENATALILALRGQATDVLQTLSVEEQADYQKLVRRLEVRYGQTNFEHVYHFQLQNRYQKSNESLQQFETDIARLVRLRTTENVMDRLTVQSFLDGLRDQQMRQALILARPAKLIDTLFRALEFEAATQYARD